MLSQQPQLENCTLEEIKDLLFSEMTPFFRLLFLLKDVEKLQGKNSPLISEELANFLVLEGFVPPKRAEEKLLTLEAIEELESSIIAGEDLPLTVEQQVAPTFKLKRKDALLKRKDLDVKTIDSEKEASEFDLGSSRNVKEIMSKLRHLGFIQIRQKGSHRTYKWQDPETKKVSGSQVVLPVGDGKKELPIGTFRSVQDMVQTALQSKGTQRSKNKKTLDE